MTFREFQAKGAKKGGVARAASMTKTERQTIARNAALHRWKKCTTSK